MITIRNYQHSDIEAFTALANNKNVARYLSSMFPSPYTLADAEFWINEGSRDGIHRAIEYQGEIVGAVGVNRKEAERYRSAAIGYWLGEPYWGRGIACEALKLLTEYVFDTTDIVRLEANIFVQNKASIRVAEKAGYQYEATLKKAVFKNERFYDEQILVAFAPGFNVN